MNQLNQFFKLSVLVSFMLALVACGDSDKGTAAAPAAPAASTPAAPAASSPAPAEPAEFDISTVEKAEGVVYQDEIYANWPYN